MVSHILDHINSSPSPLPSSSSSTTGMTIPTKRENTTPPPSSPSRPADRYEELIAENKRLSMKIKDFAASSHLRDTVRSDEEMIAIQVRTSPMIIIFVLYSLFNRIVVIL